MFYNVYEYGTLVMYFHVIRRYFASRQPLSISCAVERVSSKLRVIHLVIAIGASMQREMMLTIMEMKRTPTIQSCVAVCSFRASFIPDSVDVRLPREPFSEVIRLFSGAAAAAAAAAAGETQVQRLGGYARRRQVTPGFQ